MRTEASRSSRKCPATLLPRIKNNAPATNVGHLEPYLEGEVPVNNTPLVAIQEEKEKRMVDLKIVGGNNDLPPEDGNWLKDIEIGSIFLVREKPVIKNGMTNAEEFVLGQFQLVDRTEKTCLLVSQLNGVMKVFVDPIRFSRKYLLWETLGVVSTLVTPEIESKEEEEYLKEEERTP